LVETTSPEELKIVSIGTDVHGIQKTIRASAVIAMVVLDSIVVLESVEVVETEELIYEASFFERLN
jgi:hypothetical protein